MTTAVVTVVSGRHAHLENQLRGLSVSRVPPTHHVVVSMGDKEIRAVVGDAADVVDLEYDGGPLPLAAARNAGAQRATDLGADTLIFLDVDCIPGPDLLGSYESALRRRPNALVCRPVTYLPPGDLAQHPRPHPARPNPADGELLDEKNFDLFWSLSFALSTSTWEHVGGFFEGYTGYGGEDTDFAWTAEAAGVDLVWVGGAHAYHQYHPVSSPPVEHLEDIVVNSRLFRARWGRWPMTGWLDEFERRGLIRRDGELIECVPAG